MHNKVYEKIKKFLKENYKLLIVFIVLILLFTIPTNYEIYSPGGLINLNKRVEVEGQNTHKGSFNLTYVSSKKGVLGFYLLSFIIPNWDLEKQENIKLDDETYNDAIERQKVYLKNGNNIALYTAFKAAGEQFEITNTDLSVIAVDKEYNNTLKIGDVIKEVNGKKVENFDSFSEMIQNFEEDQEVIICVLRKDKKKEVKAKINLFEDKKIIGVVLLEQINIKTEKEVEFKYKRSESGSSGGLMTTLEIYNKLSEIDITKGLKIAGTGTIELDGSVGKIDGIKYKIMGAVKKGADVFISPSENIEEAKKIIKQEKYSIELIEAKTFNDLLERLSEL